MDGWAGRSASELSRCIAAREVTAQEVMSAHLDRIEALNPVLNAIVALRPRAELMAAAAMMDARAPQGWLHGLPVAVKDLQATAGIRTTRGSRLHAAEVPVADDLLVRRLKAAGAIVIGKTNVPEFGLGSHTFNEIYGATGNPYDPERSAGGSSGGAAAALAARMVPVADGSDMMGSLRNPAAFCNVYGFRPSYGLVPSNPGGDAFLHTLATDGPMARTVEDLARLLSAMAGPAAGAMAPVPFTRPGGNFAAGLEADMRGRRIGWLGDWGGYLAMESGIIGLCEAALAVFEELGCIVEPLPPPVPGEQLWEAWVTLRHFANLGARKAVYDDPAARALLKPEAVWEIEGGLALTPMQIHAASVARSGWYAALAALFARFDALALPAAQVFPFDKRLRYPAQIAGRTMDSYHRWMEVVVPVSLAGLPTVALPAGFRDGLPTGLQIAGPLGCDGGVLQLAQAYHRATDWPGRKPPGA